MITKKMFIGWLKYHDIYCEWIFLMNQKSIWKNSLDLFFKVNKPHYYMIVSYNSFDYTHKSSKWRHIIVSWMLYCGLQDKSLCPLLPPIIDDYKRWMGRYSYADELYLANIDLFLKLKDKYYF